MDGQQHHQEDQPMGGGEDSTHNSFYQGAAKHGRTGDYHNNNDDNFNDDTFHGEHHGHKQQRRQYDTTTSHQGHPHGLHGSRDCYEEVTAASCPPSRLLRHDWCYEVPRLGRATTPAASSSHAQLAHEAYHRQQQLVALQAECQTLDQQLQQVKHRFRAAAERCAKAMDDFRDYRNPIYEEQYEYYDNNHDDDDHTSTPTEPSQVFAAARAACNPYELLGETRSGGLNHGLFLNRSAMKLANIDALLDFDVILGKGGTHSKSIFYFADLCAAPGGFSEYLLRRCCHALSSSPSQGNNNNNKSNHHANNHVIGNNINGCRGFGMSLVGNNDQGSGTPWKLSQGPLLLGGDGTSGGDGVYYYICHGSDGTGDIFHWPNVQCLQKTIAVRKQQLEQPSGILASTSVTAQEAYGKVALVVADGGVDAQRNVSHPEAETQKLVVCQVAAALTLLQPGGRLILKLLGFGGGASAGVLQCVLQDLYATFDTLQVLKPISSRPASAERYLVCTGFQPSVATNTPQQQPRPVFDGPSWMNRILLGQDIHVAPELSTFLARADRDMLQLNLKACFAILSHLEAKTMRLTTASATATNASANNSSMGMAAIPASHSNMMDEDEDEQWIQQAYNGYHHHGGGSKGHYDVEEDDDGNRHKVNVEEFRKAWKLF